MEFWTLYGLSGARQCPFGEIPYSLNPLVTVMTDLNLHSILHTSYSQQNGITSRFGILARVWGSVLGFHVNFKVAPICSPVGKSLRVLFHYLPLPTHNQQAKGSGPVSAGW